MVGASQKEGNRGVNNGVGHLRTTCSWVKERQTGAHQKVQREGKMGSYQNSESHK